MRGLYILVEGQTEEEFINQCLCPYLHKWGIYDVRPMRISTSSIQKGGDLKFERYKNNVEKLLKTENDIIVSSLIDFFRLQTDFPKYSEAKAITDKQRRVNFLEKAIAEQINHFRFIPYIQLHEFEGLLFSDFKGYDLMNISQQNQRKLEDIIAHYTNPELLNDGELTAPSKRLENLINGYRKKLHGIIIAEGIGIETILAKCPRFANWVEELIKRFKGNK